MKHEMSKMKFLIENKYLIFFLAAVFMSIALYHSVSLRFIVDDAYITMRYSRHLAEWQGPIYNIGERIEGYTNFLWMVILSLAYKIGLDMPSVSQYLGIFLNLLTLLIIFFYSFLVESWILLWIIPVLLAFLLLKRIRWIWTWLIVLGMYVFYTVWVGGDWMNFRFYAPILPSLAVLFAWSANCIIEWIFRNGKIKYKRPSVYAFAAYLGFVFFFSSLSIYSREKPHIFKDLGTRDVIKMPPEKAEQIGEAFKILLKPDEVIAHSFAGFSAVYTDNRVIDILGQTDPIIGRQKIKERHTPGHEKGPPPNYLEKNRAIFVYPWVVDNVSGDIF